LRPEARELEILVFLIVEGSVTGKEDDNGIVRPRPESRDPPQNQIGTALPALDRHDFEPIAFPHLTGEGSGDALHVDLDASADSRIDGVGDDEEVNRGFGMCLGTSEATSETATTIKVFDKIDCRRMMLLDGERV
jgi:hypothetical protein